MTILDSEAAAKAVRRKRTPPERTTPVRNMTSMIRGKGPAAKTAAGTPAPSPTAPAAKAAPAAKEKPVASPAPIAKAVKGAKNKPASPAASAESQPVTPAPAATEATTDSPEDRAVRSGYELCEAAIRRGQEAARRFAPGMSELAGSMKDVPGAKEALNLAEGAFRAWADLATAWVRAVLPLAPPGFPDPSRVLETLREAMAGHPGAASAAAASVPTTSAPAKAQALSFAVELSSARPARVALEVSREVDVTGLAVQPLQPTDRDAGKPAILAVELVAGKDGRSIEVHLTISGAQPAGRYLGAVYEKGSGAFVGGLTVDLRD